jgi:DNA (cytosine-5)-methyltransferase 1
MKGAADVALHARCNTIGLCAGGGGIDLALELAIPGARPVCYVEREAFAVAHLVEAMRAGVLAEAPVWSDARTFDGRPWRGLVDGVVGGIPCQPHSLAGKRRAHLDERDLWGPARRIIVQVRPWFVLIENVGGILSSGGARRVWRDLQRLGFEVEGGLFSAAEVGAPHQRERFFVLGVADAAVARRQGGRPPGRRPGQRAAIERGGGDVVDADRARRPQAGGGRHVDAGSEPQPRNSAVGDAALARVRPIPVQQGRQGEADADADGPDDAVADAIGGGRDGRAHLARRAPDGRAVDERAGRPGLFPPGPGDVEAWRAVAELAPHLVPAISRHDRFRIAVRAARAAADGDPGARARLDPHGPYGLRAAVVQEVAQSSLRGVADGVAPARVDWLRLLGNGVVPLVGALALRTLADRLAAAGAACAVELMGMMDEGDAPCTRP